MMYISPQKTVQEDIRMKKEKVILAYSGGLDTTAIIPWLKENFNYDVICCCVDCGQGSELDGLEKRAKLSGASKLYIEDITDDFAENYIMPCVEAGAVYENKYLLGTSMARPAIAKKLVEIARKEHATAICHGATGKGNDQIRFELGIKALAPDIRIIAPWRMTDVWKFQSREDEIEYCKSKGIDLPFDHSNSYSRDRNLWHISHEGLELEDPANEPNYDHMLVLGVTPEKAPDKETSVTMDFEKGVPVSVNGKKMKPADIIRKLNELGGANGIGIVDIVENRVVGMKSRGVYETPGGTILMEAHKQLEELVLDRATIEFKKGVAEKLAQVVYEGKWFTPLCEALIAFTESTQKYVTGTVSFKLYKGNIIKAGTTSPFSLYSASLASFTTGDLYDHHDASGFITLFGLPLKVRAMKMQEYEASKKGAGKKASAKAAAKKVPAKAAGKTVLKPVMRHNFEAEAAVIKKNGKKK
jgi:argininosuccinate synthase